MRIVEVEMIINKLLLTTIQLTTKKQSLYFSNESKKVLKATLFMYIEQKRDKKYFD